MGLRCGLCGLAHLPTESCGRDTAAGLARAAFKAAAMTGQAFVQGGRVLKSDEVLAAAAAVAKGGFDRGKYQREYMRGWRARKRGG